MRAALLLALLALDASAQSSPRGRFGRTNSRCQAGRSDRGLSCDDLAFFELAPASGAGMGTACACATPTGAKGEAMTFTRTGAATCSPLGLATTGITNASLVECSANLPRVESASGVLGLRVEGSRTNVLTRFIDYANGAWADVGTPTLTGAQASPWTGTYANLAVQFDDNDGAAFEGRTQTVTVTAATAYIMSCYVKAGTLDTARLSLDGTTADFTGLSSSTWAIITVADASSSGVAIAAQALNGSTAAATGTVIWGGCQVEAGAYATSMIPTVAAGVTRNAEAAYVTMPVTVSPNSVAASTQVPYTSPGANRRNLGVRSGTSDANRFELFYTNGGPGASTYVEVASVGQQVNGVTAATMPGSNRFAAWRTAAGTQNVITNGTTASAATALGALPVLDRVYVGSYISVLAELDGIITSVCVDPDPTRCR